MARCLEKMKKQQSLEAIWAGSSPIFSKARAAGIFR
jgi:hypothetical protein